MPGSFARELERQMGSMFHGGLEPYEFRRWFARALWASEGSADEDALDFAYEIENIIAERSGDHITDDEMIAAPREVTVSRFGDVPAGAAL